MERAGRTNAAVACVAAALVTTSLLIPGMHRVAGAAPSVRPRVDSATGATRDADNGRTGWYPDQPGLTPSLVTGGSFGRLFESAVNGAVYAQPLVEDNQLLVVTETNYAYGLDPQTGSGLWSRHFGNPVQASDIGCSDLAPNLGITSTPVVDTATDTGYLVDNEYVSGGSGPSTYYLHALDLNHRGAEKAGFPVQIQGTASNEPSASLVGDQELQRPGLLLLNGVVYAAFGGHCDNPTYYGFVAGVSEAGHLTTLWAAAGAGGSSAAGIWMSGGGLVSDGPGTILLATGNGMNGATNVGPIPGTSPPANFGQSVVGLAVQPNGSLQATDFFSPYDATSLDPGDLDFGSGSPIALPSPYFGTASVPHLALAVGKQGYLYLLNRDHLGGIGEGAGGTDDVVARYGPGGGVWSSPTAWPGNGGWVYLPTASAGGSGSGSTGELEAYQYSAAGGTPSLTLAGHSSDAFPFGSSGAVVTSNATTSGSAILWTVWSSGESGTASELRAYDPIPVGGVLKEIWSAPIGTSSKFNPPGVAGNRIYVGTRDGEVFGFGGPTAVPIAATAPNFGSTQLGQSTTRTVTITATGPATVSSITSSGPFSLGAPSPGVPVQLPAGGTVSVPVTFTPAGLGPAGGELTVTTQGAGVARVALAANGVSPPVSPPVVGMASTPTGAGYWIADAHGDVEVNGDAGFYGSLAGVALNAPINHIVATPDGKGYWLVAADGGTFSFGDAHFFGSMGGRPLNAPVVDLAPTPDGGGYWLVASDGGIFAFGDAVFRGSMGGVPLNRPVVGVAADRGTGGYWLVASDGGVFSFDAPFYGSTGNLVLNRPVNGMAVTADAHGYWFVASDGGVFAFGDAPFHGSAGGLPLGAQVDGMASDPSSNGYWLVAADGGIFAYGAPFLGSSVP